MKVTIMGPRHPTTASIDGGARIPSSDAFDSAVSLDLMTQPAAAKKRKPTKAVVSNLVSTLMRPAARRHRNLAQSVAIIGRAPLTADKLKKAEKMLASLRDDPTVGPEAELWLAICQRLRGYDATNTFRKILEKCSDSRLAFLNLAANYLTSPIKRDDAARQVLSDLQIYTAKYPKDYFARLIEALLVNKIYFDEPQAINLLEKLYLDQKSYTPGISAMAAILTNTGRRQAGIDYAREAVTQSPWNYQALSLADYDPTTVPEIFKDYFPTAHVSFIAGTRRYESLLYGSYFLQDPLSQSGSGSNVKT